MKGRFIVATCIATAVLGTAHTASSQRADPARHETNRFSELPRFTWRYGGNATANRPSSFDAYHRLSRILDGCARVLEENLAPGEADSLSWIFWRDPQQNAHVWLVDDRRMSAAPNTTVLASFGIDNYPGVSLTGSAYVPLLMVPASSASWPSHTAARTMCHELLHSAHLAKVSASANRDLAWITAPDRGANGLPLWLAEGIGNAAVWMADGTELGGERIRLHAYAASIAQRNPDAWEAFHVLGLRSYADSLFVDTWLPRTEGGAREREPPLDVYYGVSSWMRWLAQPSRFGWRRWFTLVTQRTRLDRPRASASWVADFDTNLIEQDPNARTALCRPPNCGLHQRFGEFVADFAHEYERVATTTTGLYSQHGWLRWMFPGDGCTQFVFRDDGQIERLVRRRDNSTVTNAVPDATITVDSIDPYSARCVQLARVDAQGNRIAASFEVSIEPIASSQGGAASCDDFVLGSRAVRGTVRLSTPNEHAAHCYAGTIIDSQPTTASPNAIVLASYAPVRPSDARPTSFRLRITESGGEARRDAAASQSSSNKRTTAADRLASRAPAAASSSPFVHRGAVILHDESGPSQCDPRWETFCEPTSQIAVATTQAAANLLPGMWAVPPSMIMDLPDRYDAAGIANMSLSLAGQSMLSAAIPRDPAIVGITVPRIRPGWTGVIRRALISHRDDSSAGANALRVDERCDRRFFEPQGTVTITLNDGVRIAGTFESPMFTDAGAARDERGCVRSRRRVGSIRGRFSTGFLSGGRFFQDTHRDMPTILGNSVEAAFDRPLAWLARTRYALEHQSEQLPPEERRRRDAEGEQAVTRMISAGVGLSLPTQCRCDCGEFLNPVSRSSCAATCREPFALFEREPARCAGQRANVVAPPVVQSSANAATPSEIERQWSAFLQGLPSSARAGLQRQVDRMDPAARPTMMQTIMRMMGAMQSSMQSTQGAQPTTNAGGAQR